MPNSLGLFNVIIFRFLLLLEDQVVILPVFLVVEPFSCLVSLSVSYSDYVLGHIVLLFVLHRLVCLVIRILFRRILNLGIWLLGFYFFLCTFLRRGPLARLWRIKQPALPPRTLHYFAYRFITSASAPTGSVLHHSGVVDMIDSISFLASSAVASSTTQTTSSWTRRITS